MAAVGVVWTMFDQLTKWWALSTLSGREPLAIVWTLQLQIARNTGAAFSFGSGNGITRFLPLLVLAVVGWVVWQQRESMTRTGAVAVGMIVGGAVGNIVDRAFRTSGGGFYSGGVVDFINFQWWPVFNIADSGVVVGGILLAAVSLWSAREADGSDDPAAGNGGGEPVVPS